MTYLVNPTKISREIDNIFHQIVSRKNTGCPECNENTDFVPRVNIKEDEEKVALTFELPGIEKDDIKVTIEDKVLTISGERKMEPEPEKSSKMFVRNEIVVGSFSRSFTLPDYVSTDDVLADYKHGLLEVTLPRKEETKPKQIDVAIK